MHRGQGSAAICPKRPIVLHENVSDYEGDSIWRGLVLTILPQQIPHKAHHGIAAPTTRCSAVYQ
eukprot:scaffold129818_cov14-Tisochrysis_lutea.AAC.1